MRFMLHIKTIISGVLPSRIQRQPTLDYLYSKNVYPIFWNSARVIKVLVIQYINTTQEEVFLRSEVGDNFDSNPRGISLLRNLWKSL